MATSFVQYKYCSLCRTSCKKLRKHVHSPRHQEIVENILRKFLTKISDAKSYIENPMIKDAVWVERERQVWCYSCSCDVNLHLLKTTVLGDCVIVGAGFLGHITRKDHSDNTAKFLKDNLVDMKRTSKFTLDNNVFLRFLEMGEKASVNYLKQKDSNLKKAASFIRIENAFHCHVMNQGLLDQKRRQQLSKNTDSSPDLEKRIHLKNPKADEDPVERKKTAQAFGDGLTVVERSNEDDSEGNIHCNAVPPWLRKDEQGEIANEGIIGPSVEDWNKHKKLEQKRKLPACRVGAKFDHQTTQRDEWLPNFGGVWSHGPRTKSSAHFKKRVNSTHLKTKLDQNINMSNSPKQMSLTSYTSPPNDNRVSEKDFHETMKNGGFPHSYHQAEMRHSSSHEDIHPPFVSNTYASPSSDFGGFGNNSNSHFNFIASSPQVSSRAVKPYVSKRRKVGQNITSFSSSTIPVPVSVIQESFHPKQHFPSYISHHSHSPVSNVSWNERDKGISGYENGCKEPVNSSIRLLHTPVLGKK